MFGGAANTLERVDLASVSSTLVLVEEVKCRLFIYFSCSRCAILIQKELKTSSHCYVYTTDFVYLVVCEEQNWSDCWIRFVIAPSLYLIFLPFQFPMIIGMWMSYSTRMSWKNCQKVQRWGLSQEIPPFSYSFLAYRFKMSWYIV